MYVKNLLFAKSCLVFWSLTQANYKDLPNINKVQSYKKFILTGKGHKFTDI